MKKTVILGLLALAILVIAGKPADGLTLSYFYQSGPDRGGCYGEDSINQQLWKGTLAPGQSFQVSIPFCTYEWGGGGNSGALARVWAKGGIQLTVTSPDGVIYPGYVLESYPPKSSIRKCIIPNFDWWWWGPPYNNWVAAGTPLYGTWVATVQNVGAHTARDVSFEVYVTVPLPGWQRYFCDPADWNL